MAGRSDLDKRRLAQETEREAERGRKHKAKLTTRGVELRAASPTC